MKKILSALFVALAFSGFVFAADIPTKTPESLQSAAKSAPAQQEVVNINTADAQALTKLKGIGPKKADAILAWRKANGAFKSVDQLADVKGIGAKTVEINRKIIRI